jgi:hypothetical protein
MISKTIHYCWFGGKALPKDAERCIASWKKFLPEYEIKRWDESNFDVNSIPYTRDAYKAGKYAFVSDYARFWIIYNYGGLYFDTDVEVIHSLDDIINAGPFMGVEQQNEDLITVSPGLCLGAEKHNELLAGLIRYYGGASFINPDGSLCLTNVVEITTEFLRNRSLRNTNEIQQCCGFSIYPKDYFCPIDYTTRELRITPNTRAIHHYAESWVPRSIRIKNAIGRVMGKNFLCALVRIKGYIRRVASKWQMKFQ